MGIAREIEVAVDSLLEAYIASKSANLCTALIPIAIAGTTIYFLIMAYGMARGDPNHTFQTILWKAMRISLISGIALSAGTYQVTIVAGTEGLVGLLLESMSGFSTVGEVLDDIAKPFAELGQQLWSRAVVGYWPNAGLLAAAGIVGIAELLTVAIGLGFYLLAKVALVLVLAIGPVFLLCAMWPSTQKFTESWIGQALNYVLLKVLIGACILLLTDFSSKFASHIQLNSDAINVLKAVTALLLACGAAAVVMLNLPQLASALCGGASISGIGRTIGRAFMDWLDKTKDSVPPAGGDIRPIGGQGGGREQITGPETSARVPLYMRNTIARLGKSN